MYIEKNPKYWRQLLATNKDTYVLYCLNELNFSNFNILFIYFFLIFILLGLLLLNLIFLGKKQMNWPIRHIFIFSDIKTSISQAGGIIARVLTLKARITSLYFSVYFDSWTNMKLDVSFGELQCYIYCGWSRGFYGRLTYYRPRILPLFHGYLTIWVMGLTYNPSKPLSVFSQNILGYDK